jgi:hypothetical protein
MAEMNKVGTGNKEHAPPSLTPMKIKSSNQFMLLFVSLLRILSNSCGRQLQPDIDITKLKISWRLKMGTVLATDGKLCQTKTCTCCQWCVEGNGAGAGASDDGKRTNNGAIRSGLSLLGPENT